MKNHLKSLRNKNNISQDELASILKVSRQTINSIETGKFDPSLKLVMKMTRYFKVDLEKIFIFQGTSNLIALILLVIAVTAFAIYSSFFLSEIISIILFLVTFILSLILIIMAFSVLLTLLLLAFLKTIASIFLFLIF